MSFDKLKPPLLLPKPAITRGRVITRSTSLETNNENVSSTSKRPVQKVRPKSVSFATNVIVINEECEDQVEALDKTTLHVKYSKQEVIAEDESQAKAKSLPEFQLRPVEIFPEMETNEMNQNRVTPQPAPRKMLAHNEVRSFEELELVHSDDEYVQIEVIDEPEPEIKKSFLGENLQDKNTTVEKDSDEEAVKTHLKNPIEHERLAPSLKLSDYTNSEKGCLEHKSHSHECVFSHTTLENQELHPNHYKNQQLSAPPLPPRIKNTPGISVDGVGFCKNPEENIRDWKKAQIVEKETDKIVLPTETEDRYNFKNKPKPKPRKITKPLEPPPPPPRQAITSKSKKHLTNKQEKVDTPVELEIPVHTPDIDKQPQAFNAIPLPSIILSKKSLRQEEASTNINLPDVINNIGSQRTQSLSPKLTFIIRDLVQSEEDYTKQLGEGLMVLNKLKKENLSKETLLKFFGLFDRIHLLHLNFLKELKSRCNSPKLIGYCFHKHISRFEVYIERQWLVPNESNLDDFEKFLISSQNLNFYINTTKERVVAYVNKLQYLRVHCDKEDATCLEMIDDTLAAFEDLFYQLEMVEQFKKIDSCNNVFKESGKVYLNGIFKVSINGSKRKKYLVYLCKNVVIFTISQTNGVYQYVEGVPTSKCYCSTKIKRAVFEIGLSGRKRFIMEAESLAVKERWCEELKNVLRSDQFD